MLYSCLLLLLPVLATAQRPLSSGGFAKKPEFNLPTTPSATFSIPGIFTDRPILTVFDDEGGEDGFAEGANDDPDNDIVDGAPVPDGLYLLIALIIFYGISHRLHRLINKKSVKSVKSVRDIFAYNHSIIK
jgi:hypothetical protein